MSTHRGEIEFQLASEGEGLDQLEADTITDAVALVLDQWKEAEGQR